MALIKFSFIYFLGKEVRPGKLKVKRGEKKLLCKAVDCVKTLTAKIGDSTLTVAMLKLLCENKEQFIKLSVALNNDNDTEGSKIKLTDSINQLMNNVKNFEKKRDKISSFVQLCKGQDIVTGRGK